MRLRRRYGLLPQRTDSRDLIYSAKTTSLPPKVDLSPKFDRRLDQTALGACTANTFAHLLRYLSGNVFDASRLFIYYNERAVEGTVNSDSGARIRDGVKVLNKQGACEEKLWPYLTSKYKVKPPAPAYKAAKHKKVLKYQSIDNTKIDLIKASLAAEEPVVIGFTVYSSFESDTVARTGHVPMPGRRDKILGGHCTLLTGYDDSTGLFDSLNCWGEQWGRDGFFDIPYEYLTNPKLASDFWNITKLS